MTVFWSLVTCMALLALGFILAPLLRQRTLNSIDRNELNTQVTHARLAELAQDFAAGRIEQTQYHAARQDLERELLNDLDTVTVKQPVHSGRWAALLIAISLPLSAALLYQALGNADIIALLQQPASSQSATQQAAAPSIEEMVQGLAARLEQEPDNLNGWIMLARSYRVLGRIDQALPAYRNILRLGGSNDANILADYADALVTTSNGTFTDETGQLLTRALSLEPDNIKALWLAGHWQYQAGEPTTAIAYWQRAAVKMQPGSYDRLVINRQIELVSNEAILPPIVATATPAMQDIAPPATAPSLQVHVALDPALAGNINPDDTVFIFARAVDGPRMPLAVARHQARELPLTVMLDDSMSMSQALKLSGFNKVTVGARISKSGNAMPQSGDLLGLRTPVTTTNTARHDIIIDSIIP